MPSHGVIGPLSFRPRSTHATRSASTSDRTSARAIPRDDACSPSTADRGGRACSPSAASCWLPSARRSDGSRSLVSLTSTWRDRAISRLTTIKARSTRLRSRPVSCAICALDNPRTNHCNSARHWRSVRRSGRRPGVQSNRHRAQRRRPLLRIQDLRLPHLGHTTALTRSLPRGGWWGERDYTQIRLGSIPERRPGPYPSGTSVASGLFNFKSDVPLTDS